MQNSMLELLALLRAMQLFYHNCHNTVSGSSFVADHGLFGEFYEALEADYDSVAERLIGIYGKQALPLKLLIEKTEDILESMPEPSTLDAENMFAAGGLKELTIKVYCEEINRMSEASVGVQNLIGTICDNFEMRMYKIRQRLG